MTKIIRSPEKYGDKKKNGVYVFLAGPIQGSGEWQHDIEKDLSGIDNLIITNPRRKTFKEKDFNFDEQVSWETENLNKSDIILFWIPKEKDVVEGRLYGQTTRFELAEWIVKANKKIIVGIEEGFAMKRYIKNRLEKDYNKKVYNTYDEVLSELKNKIKEISDAKCGVLFSSDTHFGSKRTFELSKRPFLSVEKMDEQMIINWNMKVKPNDDVFHLGDFGDYDVVNKLNGNIYLILGNYEIEDMNKNYKGDFKDFKDMLIDKGFKNVFENLKMSSDISKYNSTKIVSSSMFSDNDLFLTHEPLNANKQLFTLFGHIHGRQMIKRYGLDVGTDCHNLTPISMDEVLFYKNAIENFYDNNVFE